MSVPRVVYLYDIIEKSKNGAGMSVHTNKMFLWGILLLWLSMALTSFYFLLLENIFVAVCLIVVILSSSIPFFFTNNNMPSSEEKRFFCKDYEKLKSKWGPILKEIPVYVRLNRRICSEIGVRKLSICEDALFLTNTKGYSLCIPFSEYSIRKEEYFLLGKVLSIGDVTEEKVTQKNISPMYESRNSFCFLLLSSSKKELDNKDMKYIMSLVERFRQKQ